MRLFLSAAALPNIYRARISRSRWTASPWSALHQGAGAVHHRSRRFVGGRFFYAVRVDTSQGFEPARPMPARYDATACPAEAPGDIVQILREFDHPLIPRWGAVLAARRYRHRRRRVHRGRSRAARSPTTSTRTRTLQLRGRGQGRPARDGRAPARYLGRRLPPPRHGRRPPKY